MNQSITNKLSTSTVLLHSLHMLMCGSLFLVLNPSALSQGINNSAVLNTQTGLVVNVQGGIRNNNTGTILGNGTLRLSGDWMNYGIFTANAGNVILDGGNQLIGGTGQSSFNNLELEGSGIKTLGLDATLSGVLALNDQELATDTNIFFITNTATNAITRTSGFVSSSLVDSKSGSLSRQTAGTGVYLFPVGSSVGIPRYRPTEITPASDSANTFTVIFYNYDANLDGWDRGLKTTDIGIANPSFYTSIKRPFGSDPATISMYYDEIFDDAYIGMANWKGGQWNSMPGVTMSSGTLNRLTTTNWADFSTAPYIITKDYQIPPPDIQFFIYNTFTPDDNGKNDTWQIDNIDKFPYNEVQVFNRWGGLVYEASPYLNDWDGTLGGEKLPVTAYYYIVKLGDDTPALTGTVNITR